MGVFEEIAILGLKFRVVLAALVVTFLGVSLPILLVFESEAGFLVGAIAALFVAYLTARKLS
ncbi:hypothetical protein [Halorubrum salsamenti]|uniref:hypothetical protein n=1 Tax=Halorubrum salsamenti TaxID=2583990 RepID=UPI0011A0C326|nr:hypothetical protein [Halorubrum salsamenti]